MIEGLKAYPEYKESDVPWTRTLPKSWQTERAKWLFTKMNRPVRPEDDVVTCFRDGMVTLRKNRRLRGFTEATAEFGYQGIRKGDLVIHQMDAFAGAVGVSDSDGKGTPVYSVCQPRVDANPKYYAHTVREMARAQWILALAKGIRERSTDFRYETFGNQRVPLPPLDEQLAIVRFLDHANRKIDGFIRSKRKLIGLLNEQKQAIIHRAVTRGLDPNAKLKPSGIPWLGEIPEHWEVRRMKNVGKTKIGLTYSPGDVTESTGHLVLRASNIKNGQMARGNDVFVKKSIPEGLRVRTGDILICARSGSRSLVGKSALIPQELEGVTFGAFMSLFRSPINDFVFWVLNSNLFKFVMAEFETSTINQLTQGELNKISIPVPPRTEQLEIIDFIQESVARLNTAIARTEREIALMQEYRTRLTADIVTGKLDVREAAAKLPEIAIESGEERPIEEETEEVE